MARKIKIDTLAKKIGIGISIAQFLVSIVFMVSLYILNMFSTKYLVFIGLILLIFALITLTGQLAARKNAIFGKLIGLFFIVVLAFGSYFILKMDATIQNMTQKSDKVDTVVVAVLADDPAQTLRDAKDYNFGVQYKFKGDVIKDAVEKINTEVNQTVDTTEYTSVPEQAHALFANEVGAIVYNEAYTSILEDEIEGYSDQVRIIYSCDIVSEVKEIVLNTVQEPEPEVDDHTFALYISGIDVYGNIGTTSRSDVNIIAVVNTDTHQVLLITTPRDYYVPIPTVSGGERDKLTHAGIYGVEASIATLEQLYGMNIDYYARVNFTSVVKIVNALGGISVYSNQAFTTGNLTIHEGYNDLNGEQALAFSRERHNVDGGDFQRGKNQQEVIKGIIRKAISPAILLGANDILNSVSGNVDTNMPTSEIQDLIKDQLDTRTSWNIKSMAAVGTGDSQTCYSIPNSYVYVAWPDQNSIDEIKAAVEAVKNGELLDGSEVAQ